MKKIDDIDKNRSGMNGPDINEIGISNIKIDIKFKILS